MLAPEYVPVSVTALTFFPKRTRLGGHHWIYMRRAGNPLFGARRGLKKLGVCGRGDFFPNEASFGRHHLVYAQAGGAPFRSARRGQNPGCARVGVREFSQRRQVDHSVLK